MFPNVTPYETFLYITLQKYTTNSLRPYDNKAFLLLILHKYPHFNIYHVTFFLPLCPPDLPAFLHKISNSLYNNFCFILIIHNFAIKSITIKGNITWMNLNTTTLTDGVSSPIITILTPPLTSFYNYYFNSLLIYYNYRPF